MVNLKMVCMGYYSVVVDKIERPKNGPLCNSTDVGSIPDQDIGGKKRF